MNECRDCVGPSGGYSRTLHPSPCRRQARCQQLLCGSYLFHDRRCRLNLRRMLFLVPSICALLEGSGRHTIVHCPGGLDRRIGICPRQPIRPLRTLFSHLRSLERPSQNRRARCCGRTRCSGAKRANNAMVFNEKRQLISQPLIFFV